MRSIGARLGISLFVSLLLAGVLVGQGALWWLEREQRRISAGVPARKPTRTATRVLRPRTPR